MSNKTPKGGASDQHIGGSEVRHAKPRRRIQLLRWHFHLPESRALRIVIGVMLCILGVFGFLPVLGFWMIPLGFLILSYEFAAVRRQRRRIIVWWERRRKRAKPSADIPK